MLPLVHTARLRPHTVLTSLPLGFLKRWLTRRWRPARPAPGPGAVNVEGSWDCLPEAAFPGCSASPCLQGGGALLPRMSEPHLHVHRKPGGWNLVWQEGQSLWSQRRCPPTARAQGHRGQRSHTTEGPLSLAACLYPGKEPGEEKALSLTPTPDSGAGGPTPDLRGWRAGPVLSCRCDQPGPGRWQWLWAPETPGAEGTCPAPLRRAQPLGSFPCKNLHLVMSEEASPGWSSTRYQPKRPSPRLPLPRPLVNQCHEHPLG